MGWFKKQKPGGLYAVPDHYLDEYDIEDWDSIISEFYSVEEWEDLMWEVQMSVLSEIVYGGIKVNAKPTSGKSENNPKSIWEVFSHLIPLQFREMIIGDLNENRVELGVKGFGRFNITLIIGIKFLIILFALLRISLFDFLIKDREKEKNK